MPEASIMRARALLALLALSTLIGCSTSAGPVNTFSPPPNGNAILAKIVGVGDSLTAGEQSGGILGATGVTSPFSGFPGNIVPPGQENGFWSLLYQQATGTSVAAMYDPATSPLPLIGGPGLGAQLVVTPTGAFAATHSSCDAFNNSGFSLGTFAGTRLNPGRMTFDLGVPGQTAHEALYMTNPITGPPPSSSCAYPLNPADPSTALQPVVSGESGAFYPVLGGFARGVAPLTQVNAAVSLHPTLVTVWLGANDLLKFIFTGGQAPSDSPSQMQMDITKTIQQLQGAGARVVVANLPDVLLTPQFFKGGPTLAATLEAPPFDVPATPAAAVTSYVQTTYGVGPNGYLTESGFFKVLATIEGGSVTPALGIGDFLTDSFAAQVQGLNNAYNQAIGAAARSTGAPLVDIRSFFETVSADSGIPVNPPFCCSLAFGGGLLGLDGLHPSNTGYALLTNVFIQTINTGYKTAIPLLTNAQILAISQTDPYAPPGGFARLLALHYHRRP
jgi:lysophospholipase L1-like esterase